MRTHFVSRVCLSRASLKVAAELACHGIWSQRLQAVPVKLVPVGTAYGWHCYHCVGEICVPRVSLAKLRDLLSGSYTGVADVVRHEYGHALHNSHRGLFRSRRFSEAFGRAHDSTVHEDYNPALHVSPYAATAACEDFAETFMFYLRRKGKVPIQSTPALSMKWHFIGELCRAIQCGQTRW